MANKVALIVLDKVVADSAKRFELAEKAKVSFLEGEKREGNTPSQKEINDIYWGAALNGDMVYLDEIIDGVHGQLNTLESLGWQIVFFTARPEWSMKVGTLEWLRTWNLLGHDRALVMKPETARWDKTPKWKAARGLGLAMELAATELLVVDDEKANNDEILARALHSNFSISVYSSLQEAIDALAIAQDGEEQQREKSGSSTVDMIIDLLETDVNELEAGQRVYTSSGDYGNTRYHVIEKMYDGLQIDQTETSEKWGKRINFHRDELPGLIKTLLNWYLEDQLQKIADSMNEDDHPF